MTYTTDLLRNIILNQDIYSYGTHWQEKPDHWKRHVLALVSDIGDELGTIWKSKEGNWHNSSGVCLGDFELATKDLERSLTRGIAVSAENLSERMRRSNPKGLHQISGCIKLNTFERYVIEKSIASIIQKVIGQFSVQSTLKLNDPVSDNCPIKVHPITLGFRFQEGKCVIKPQALPLKTETKHVENGEPVITQIRLCDLSDQSFMTTVRKLMTEQNIPHSKYTSLEKCVV